ncbi:hypothetical protein GCM10028775_03890 [Catellatospora paridis]
MPGAFSFSAQTGRPRTSAHSPQVQSTMVHQNAFASGDALRITVDITYPVPVLERDTEVSDALPQVPIAGPDKIHNGSDKQPSHTPR